MNLNFQFLNRQFRLVNCLFKVNSILKEKVKTSKMFKTKGKLNALFKSN